MRRNGATMMHMTAFLRTLFSVALVACGTASANDVSSAHEASPQTAAAQGETVTPPFAVSGNASGLMLWWYDRDGVHVANSRDEIPSERRAEVRVDSPNVAPEARLDPDFVYVADLRASGATGYSVRKLSRDAFDQAVESTTTAGTGNAGSLVPESAEADPEISPQPGATPNSSQVVVYSASWCGACRQAKAYLRSRGINFVERDIERDPGAREEMQGKLNAQGMRAGGVPVLDIRGRILLGFSAQAVDAALQATGG